ncbi:Hydrolase, alpha/beta fold family [Saccharolobus shibatae B12]|uniref:Hydrolase, alpha/beta fold family n=1 Tax=Saccharolobus shibatae (strain ATCC 51178 / DSM 5389 / JCM 8931 / NBRC 15437 / B12) TaxID=523848 RepID=A0A8F5BQ46_SACSH|nr:alpha/beta hydrolase [Saccharolobus shibatae]QXJ29418.1 Hydrolase, alpha/beta fold family [Saccharolobus shibatae B12]
MRNGGEYNFKRLNAEFYSEGVKLKGWLYLPEGSEKFPAIVMAHGFSAVKEMYLDNFAEVLAKAGFVVLVYDNRNFGESEGEPRQEIDPWQQVKDYRYAISYIRLRSEIDPERIGIWGTSYSGGHVIVVGSLDSRVKAVVAQVPLVSGSENLRRLVRSDMMPQLRAMFAEDYERRIKGEKPLTIPVVCKSPPEMCALPTADSYEWFIETGKKKAPNWKNEVTLRSVEYLSMYEPVNFIKGVSPKPIMLVVAQNDVLTPMDLALEAYERALPPKELEMLSGGHFDAYVKEFERSSKIATNFFLQHLGKR